MRVTQNMLTQQFLYNLTNDNSRISQEQNQMSTGKTLNQPSDNPLGVSQDMAIRSTLMQSTAYQGAISASMTWMNNTSAALQGITTSLQSVRENLIEGLNAANQNPSAMQALAETTQQLVDQINNLADSKQDDRYLLGGTQTSLAPSSYVGALLPPTASDAYDYPVVGSGSGASAKLPPAPIAASVADGNGVLIGGQSYKLKFDASSISTNGTVQNGTIELISENGQTIASGVIPSGTVSGSNITMTTLASPAAGITITLGNFYNMNSGYSGKASYSQTDSLTAKSTTGISPGTQLNYQVGPNVQLAVNVTGYDVFHVVHGTASSDLTSTLQHIVTDLSASSTTNLQQDLTDLSANLNSVINMNAELGTKIQRVTALQNQMTQYTQQLTDQQSNLEDANMAQVITQFSTDQTVYQAALKMGAEVLLPSLITFLPN